MTHSAADGNMVDNVAQFDLRREMAESEQKKPWPSGIHSKTLFKKPDFRMVLIEMETGARMDEHHADGTICVQIIKGSIRFRTLRRTHELGEGNLLTLGASIKHDLEALEESALLLMIAWPSNQELLQMSHRGYGT